MTRTHYQAAQCELAAGASFFGSLQSMPADKEIFLA